MDFRWGQLGGSQARGGAVLQAAPFLSSRSGVESILPANAHELAHGRLHVSITNTRTGQNCLVSSFPCREDLVKVKAATAHGAGSQPAPVKVAAAHGVGAGQRWSRRPWPTVREPASAGGVLSTVSVQGL